MKSADPIFIEEFVKQCCIAGLSLETTIPPHSPTPVRVPTVSGAAGVKAISLQ